MKRFMAFGLALCMGVTALTGCADGTAATTAAVTEAQTGQAGNKAEDKAQEEGTGADMPETAGTEGCKRH